MPSPRLPGLVSKPIGLSSRRSGYVCNSCLLQTASQSPKHFGRLFAVEYPKKTSILAKPWLSQVAPRVRSLKGIHKHNTRYSSTTPTPRPAISINAPSRIPLTTRGIHEALQDLEQEAVNYVPLSRIKLAIRSVEKIAEDTVVRVALLGIGGTESVKQLVRCLLADVLSDKGKWEKALEEQDDDRAILLR
jgi:hypothetical protein